MTDKQNIQHEAEAQRQHIRIQIPASAIINEQQYPLMDLSSGGLRIGNFDQKVKKSDILDIALRLPFQSFTLNIDLRSCIEHIHADTNELGCRFVELSHEQISILTYVIKSYMAGQVVSEGDILQVISRDNFVKMRNVAKTNTGEETKTWIARLIGITGLSAIGLAALFFIGSNIFSNIAISHSDNGRITTQDVTIRAYSHGIFNDMIPAEQTAVTKGQNIAVIDFSKSSEAILANKTKQAKITLTSPCDCTILRRHAVDGGFYNMGDKLYTFIPNGSTAWAEVVMDSKLAVNLKPKMKATFTVSGYSEKFTGRVQSLSALPVIDNRIQTLIRIKPDTVLPDQAVDRPISTDIWHFSAQND